MAVRRVPITGSVLRWAMADADLTAAELAHRTEASLEEVQAWLVEREQPSTKQFNQIASAVGRPPSFLLMPEAPPNEQISISYRKLRAVENEDGERGADQKAIQLARRLQETTEWLGRRLRHSSPEVPEFNLNYDTESAALWLRFHLQWSLDEQLEKGRTAANVAQLMRGKLQDLGILVLHVSLSADTVRGFSLPNESAPLIAINTKDIYEARLFSYVHELAHLSLRSGALCLNSENYGEERWCNQVAAALLMPADRLSSEVQSRKLFRGENPIGDVRQLARLFRVSMSSMAIRVESLGWAENGLFDEINGTVGSRKRKGGTFDPDRIRNKARARIQDYGRAFVGQVLEADDSGLLPRYQALDLLRLSRAEYDELRQISDSGVEG